MIIELDFTSETPIYLQLRNEIVKGIASGKFQYGEALPTVRTLAKDLQINNMTVNKAYQILKAEGFIEIDRRKGATVRPVQQTTGIFREKLESELELLSAEACLKGIRREEFLDICDRIFCTMHAAESEVTP